MKIIDFCDRYEACAEGRKWALAQSVETMAELWELPVPSNWRIWIATRPGVLTPQQRVVFACRCVRRVWYLMEDERSRTAIAVAERWARGEASDAELATAARASMLFTHDVRPDNIENAYSSGYHAAYASHSAAAAAYASVHADAAAYSAVEATKRNHRAAERDWQAQELVRMFGNPYKKGEKK